MVYDPIDDAGKGFLMKRLLSLFLLCVLTVASTAHAENGIRYRFSGGSSTVNMGVAHFFDSIWPLRPYTSGYSTLLYLVRDADGNEIATLSLKSGDFGGLDLSTDSDGSGIPDELEDALYDSGYTDAPSGTYGQSDYSKDSDGDGISDGMENLAGTDPNDADDVPTDTDGDGAPDTVDFYPEDPKYGMNSDDWAAYEQLDGPGDVDGDGIANSEDTDIDGDGILNQDELHFGSDPTNPNNALPDSDGDGASDAYEEWAGTGPYNPDSHPYETDDGAIHAEDYTDISADTDGDGVSDYFESYYGADPNDSSSTPTDSDYDGYPDAAESEAGSDPNNSWSIPGGASGNGSSGGGGSGGSGGGEGSSPWTPDPNYNPGSGSYEDNPNSPGDDDDEAPEDQEDSTITDDEVAAAVQQAIQASKGSIADAVAAGVWDAQQNLDDEVAQGIYKSMDYIETAVGRALENTLGDMSEDIAEAVSEGVSNGVSDGINEAFSESEYPEEFDVELGLYEGFEGDAQALTDATGMGALIEDLTPTGQGGGEFEIVVPHAIRGIASTQDTVIGTDEDFTWHLDFTPDENDAFGTELMLLRDFIRALLAVFMIWVFARSVRKTVFNVT